MRPINLLFVMAGTPPSESRESLRKLGNLAWIGERSDELRQLCTTSDWITRAHHYSRRQVYDVQVVPVLRWCYRRCLSIVLKFLFLLPFLRLTGHQSLPAQLDLKVTVIKYNRRHLGTLTAHRGCLPPIKSKLAPLLLNQPIYYLSQQVIKRARPCLSRVRISLGGSVSVHQGVQQLFNQLRQLFSRFYQYGVKNLSPLWFSHIDCDVLTGTN